MLLKLLLIGILGGAGALCRFWVGGLMRDWLGTSFPFGTMTANVLGCLLFGIVWQLGESRMLISNETRVIILTGFMGAFTTFSTYTFELSNYLRDSQWGLAATYFFGSEALGLGAIVLGILIGRLL
ncbi:Putative fluoride ion transporter CrcB [Planctomycetes bacterium Pan216]|uniref:Fluoride-specific ion channel FluC n=1 Tax=Kolteria novifilia TaxID=2527975 RepID=A0A518B0X6_9BACT|nr:Putative fluoride ion transporter CrcB [Planctomycetes bacterium Pan216]